LFGAESWFSSPFGSGYDLNLSDFLIVKALIVVKVIFLALKFSFRVILKSIYKHLATEFRF